MEYPENATAEVAARVRLAAANQLLSRALPVLRQPMAADDARSAAAFQGAVLALRQAHWIYELIFSGGDELPPEIDSDAGLGLGMSELYLGWMDAAQASLAAVVEEFPDTPNARRARGLLTVIEATESAVLAGAPRDLVTVAGWATEALAKAAVP